MGFTKASGRAAFGGYFVFNGIHHFRELKNLKSEGRREECGLSGTRGTGLPPVLLIASGLSLGLGIKPRA